MNDLEAIDLSGETVFPEYYHPRLRTLDWWRGVIAASLVALLAAIVLLAFAALMAGLATAADLTDLLTIILSPVVALVGTALGFYFGGREERDG